MLKLLIYQIKSFNNIRACFKSSPWRCRTSRENAGKLR